MQLYGPVGFEEGFDHLQVLEALEAMEGDPVSVYLNSEGGDVNTGFGLFNAFRQYPGAVSMHVDVQAYSIASVVMLAGDRITASSNATVMVHNAWTIALGNGRDFRQLAEVLDLFDGQIAEAYSERSGKDRDYWLDVMSRETYFTAKQAAEVGLIDEVVGTEAKVTAKADPIAVAMDFPARSQATAKLKAKRLRNRRLLS